ncbi:MAG: carboxypeptidase regulatory-like domain-containing protein [Lachnospiraceae bacterium]|nr:carboxypeptidase regulatory-like domain-containing protein [Lachnospiraceae bacterium]
MMKVKDVWYYHYAQEESEILQPELVIPESHVGIYCEAEEWVYPVSFHILGLCKGEVTFEKEVTVSGNGEDEDVSVRIDGYGAVFKFREETDCEPDMLRVTYEVAGKTETFETECKYYTFSGQISDFDGNPFPAVVMLYRYGFDEPPFIMGTWSDRDGKYSFRVPAGSYNVMYADDNTYGISSLECWGWNIIADRDETIDLKIGNGEVYSLNVSANNGGMRTLFLTFRPMIYFKKEEYNAVVGEETIYVSDFAPEIAKEDVTVYVNGRKTDVLSLQKIYEASLEGWFVPMYMVQIPRELYADCLDKQTIVLEYDTKDRGNGRACSRGFTQFYYKDGFCTR